MTPSTGADDSTRDRIVTAAKTEFSQHGIAGARIDRIAKTAKTSKERVYAYFRSKEALYRFVSGQELSAVAAATRLDPTDLPGYVGRVHDYFTSHPDRLRLMVWGQLELDGGARSGLDDSMRESVRRKIEQLREAQEAGDLDLFWDPLDILVLANHLALSWVTRSDLIPAGDEERARFLAGRRTAVIAAAQRLFPAAAHDGVDSTP